MEKRIRALKAIILVVVMIVELFGVDAVRVVAETINVTGDTTISTEDNRDYAVTDCTLTVSSTGNITGTVYGSGGKIVNQGSISKIERNIEVDNQAGASIQDLQSSVGITNAGHITSATYSSTYTLTNSGTIDTLNVQNPGYSGSTATVNMNAGTISSLNVTNYSGMNPVINYAGGTITSLIAEGTNGADLVVSGSHEISQLKGTVNVSGSGMLTVSGALQLEKGYTGEKLTEIFQGYGVSSAMVSLGGNIQAIGTKPDGSSWRVGIRDPKGSQQDYAGVLQVQNEAVVTSGGYERYFEEDGRTYIHIIDPRTGYPVENDLLSVTIVSPDGTLADGLSTALYIMGYDKAVQFWEQHQDEFDVILITADEQIHVSKKLQDSFQSDKNWETIE